MLIDFRSDTVTKPTQAMREAMAAAEVGDDVYREDPTVNRLEQRSAELLGFEAGLLTASGTMSNLLALLAHCRRGDEVLTGANSHTFLNEVGGAAALAGVQLRTFDEQDDGLIAEGELVRLIRGSDVHWPRTALLCLENTHNFKGGVIADPARQRAVLARAAAAGIPVHLDGARIFNAVVELGKPASEVVRGFSSVAFCLSKGLGAPIGSILVGSREFIDSARKYRKMVGGGMRQVGVIAAAGLVSLDSMIDRLRDDHRRAKRLAGGIEALGLPTLVIPKKVETNIVMIDTPGSAAATLQQQMKERGVLITAIGPERLRAVTHCDVDDAAIEASLDAFKAATSGAALSAAR